MDLKERTEIISAIKEAFDGRFEQIDGRFEQIDARFDEVFEAMHAFSEATDRRFDKMDKRMTRMESLMVTKDYLDDKFSDFRGDVVQMIGRAIGKHETNFHAA